MAVKKKNEYGLVIEGEEIDLIRQVNEMMMHGWLPEGGPSVYPRKDGAVLIQAMVKIPQSP
jgi:hypothetical protein